MTGYSRNWNNGTNLVFYGMGLFMTWAWLLKTGNGGSFAALVGLNCLYLLHVYPGMKFCICLLDEWDLRFTEVG